MADWDFVYKNIKAREGPYAVINIKHDRGGRTYCGISERAHPKLAWLGVAGRWNDRR